MVGAVARQQRGEGGRLQRFIIGCGEGLKDLWVYYSGRW